MRHNPPPSNQMQFPGLESDSEGQQRMDYARKFAAANHLDLWPAYLNIVEEDMKTWPDGKASANDCLMIFKKRYRKKMADRGFKLADNMAAALSRVAYEQDPKRYRFRFAKSDCDGFCEAKL